MAVETIEYQAPPGTYKLLVALYEMYPGKEKPFPDELPEATSIGYTPEGVGIYLVPEYVCDERGVDCSCMDGVITVPIGEGRSRHFVAHVTDEDKILRPQCIIIDVELESELGQENPPPIIDQILKPMVDSLQNGSKRIPLPPEISNGLDLLAQGLEERNCYQLVLGNLVDRTVFKVST